VRTGEKRIKQDLAGNNNNNKLETEKKRRRRKRSIMNTTTNPLVSLSHPPASQTDIENQMAPVVQGKEGKKVDLNKKSGKAMVKRGRTFDRLPLELLRLVLTYYAKTFQAIIAFSCINKACKEVADHSSLWKTMKPYFYCTRDYLVATGENIQETESAEQYVERILSGYYGAGKIYNKDFLRQEERFPPIFKVQIVERLCYVTVPTLRKVEITDVSHDYAFKVRNWFMEFFIDYQKHFAWHGKWRGTFNWMLNLEKKWTPYIPFISFSYLILSCLVAFLFSNFDSHSLTLQNHLGFALLYFIFATLLGFDLFYILLVYCSKASSNYHSLAVSFCLYDTMYLDQIAIGLFTVLVSVFLIQLKLTDVLSCSWMVVTIPLWIFGTVGTVLVSFATKYLLVRTYQKILLVLLYGYLPYSICLVCSLIALHFDNNLLLRSFSVGYYLIPLYPFFLAAIVLSFLKTFLTLRTYYQYFIQKERIGKNFRGSSTWGDVIFLIISTSGSLAAIVMSFSVVMLCISCFMDNGKNDAWDKAVFGIHFSPLVLVLLMLCSSFGFLTFFSVEGSFEFH
jgi:hypothetical protein